MIPLLYQVYYGTTTYNSVIKRNLLYEWHSVFLDKNTYKNIKEVCVFEGISFFGSFK